MITVYQRTDCPFCWKVRIALSELGLEYQVVETRLGEKHPEVGRLSPTGSVPVLVDGETSIWESAVILEYLDTRYAPGKLFGSQNIRGRDSPLSRPNWLIFKDSFLSFCQRQCSAKFQR